MWWKNITLDRLWEKKKADGVIDTHWISIIDQNLQTIEIVAIHCHKMLFKPIMISDNTQTKYCKLTAKHTINQHDKCCQQLSVWLLKGVFNSMNILHIERTTVTVIFWRTSVNYGLQRWLVLYRGQGFHIS